MIDLPRIMASKNNIHVYTTQIIEPWPQEVFDRMMNIIPKDLQLKVMEEEGWEDQHGSLARKLMLWHGMEEIGANMSDLFESLEFTKSGKPFIVDAPHFSLANDGAVAACAISEESILGIDVERLKPLNLSDYREEMTYLEWREIYSHMIPLRRFYEFWTIKESVIKADGQLENVDIKEIYIQPDIAFCNAKNWYIHPAELEYYGYISFMVSSNPHADLEVIDIDLLEIFK
jgi:4'-phosphopantetheinyl transferase